MNSTSTTFPTSMITHAVFDFAALVYFLRVYRSGYGASCICSTIAAVLDGCDAPVAGIVSAVRIPGDWIAFAASHLTDDGLKATASPPHPGYGRPGIS
jgi:hypothetical protein